MVFTFRRERDAANFKRGPKKKAEAQEKNSIRPSASSQRDRRQSTSSSSEGDSDDGDSSSGESSSGSSDEDETDAKTPANNTKAPEVEKKTVTEPIKPSLSAPPMCREAAKAAGPKIASALRAQQSSSSSETKDKRKEKQEKAEKDSLGATKRKAEVLSDNGRVGVTISTTSLDRSKSPKSPRSPNPVGPLSPNAKVPRLTVVTPPRAAASADTVKEPHVTLSISLSPNGEAVARPGLDWRERSSQQQTQQPQQRSLSQDEQSAKMALLSLQRGANKYSPGSPTSRSGSPTRPVPVLSPALPIESGAHPPGSRAGESGGSLSDQENVNLSNGHGPRSSNKQQHQQPTADLITPGLDYWYRKNPLVDQIFITDVTVNLMTVGSVFLFIPPFMFPNDVFRSIYR